MFRESVAWPGPMGRCWQTHAGRPRGFLQQAQPGREDEANMGELSSVMHTTLLIASWLCSSICYGAYASIQHNQHAAYTQHGKEFISACAA